MGTKVSEFRKTKFGYFFDFLDLDKDGYLTEHDHKQNITNLKKELNLGQKGEITCRRLTLGWWALFQEEADKNGGRIEKEYFVNRLAEYYEIEDLSETIEGHNRAIFRFIDRDEDLAVSFEEFFAYYRAHNCLDEHLVREIFSRLDTNKNGSLSEEEFISAHITFWLSDDPENGGEFLYKTCLGVNKMPK